MRHCPACPDAERGCSCSLKQIFAAEKTKSGQPVTADRLFLCMVGATGFERPPAPKAGALPCCATLRDGMFCTQKALLWQGRPVWRPRALPALREKPPPAGQDRGPLSLARQMTTADRAPSIDKDEREHAGRPWPFPPRRKRISRRPFPANEAYPLPCTRE